MLAVPRRDREVAELGAVGVEHLVAARRARRGSSWSRCPARSRPGCRAARWLARPRSAVFHQVATLIASQRRERRRELVVVGEGAHRAAQLEPVGRVLERPQRDVVAAVGQAVEVLEDDAMTAADDRALGDVDDAQPAVLGEHRRARRRTPPSAPRRRAVTRARARRLGAAGGGLVVVQPRRRDVGHLVARLPGAQAVVDVLVAHPVRLVEQPDRVERRRAGCTCRRRWPRASGRRRRPAPVGGLAAVAVVEPLRRAARCGSCRRTGSGCRGRAAWRRRSRRAGRCSSRAAGRPASRAAGITSELSRTTSWSGSAARRPRLALTAKPPLASPAITSMPSIRAQGREVLGAAGVVGDDDPHAVGRRRPPDLRHQSGHERRVAVAGDDDRHRPAVVAIPPPRGGRRRRAGRCPGRGAVQAGQAQREHQRVADEPRHAVIAVGEMDAPGQVRPADPVACRPAGSATRRPV